jgi:predicted NACHT family NTPase
MDRGLRASVHGIEVAKRTLKLKGWTQDYLSGMAGCSRPTVFRFLAGQRIEKRIAQDICNALNLTWGEIVTIDSDESIDRLPNIDELVETIRINIYDSIQTKCGSMRVLDMTQPIDLNAIYINVNILEKITGRQRLEYKELLQSCAPENFERFSLSGVQEAHIPALEAIDKYAKLMILGKPGAAKTTFLKYVALQCIEGKFKPHLIPLFITLKDFAEAEQQPSLLEYVIQLLESYSITPETRIKKGLFNSLIDRSATPVEFLLRQGRFSILLDGLDEVREADSKRISKQIQDFSNLFANNIFVITCRIAAREYTFEKFTEVEVTDFDDRQIATFIRQWFQTKNDPIKAENFIEKLKQEPEIRQLASSPILLTLLCLVFGDLGGFPLNRSELYKEGLNLLLKKWDAQRNIERDWVYQKLSLKHKEDLLSQIALETFEKCNYFFKQKEIERYITEYIRNLPEANLEKDALKLDSEAVLKSIESQHSLLVERARGIYSFSHLIFHEYFAARKIVTSANPDSSLQEVAIHVKDRRWREVLLLTVGMLDNPGLLLEAMKQKIDIILNQDEKLQKFLVWVDRKSLSISNYKPAAVRAYYLNLGILLSLNHRAFVESYPLTHLLDSNFPILSNTTLSHNDDLHLSLIQTPRGKLVISSSAIVSFHQTPNFSSSSNYGGTYDHDRDLDFAINLNLAIDLDLTLTNSIKSIELQTLLQNMKNQLPCDISLENRPAVYKWWDENGQAWTNKLRGIAIEHRNIGHDWQFSETQKKSLQQYYDANKLLIDCLNSDCYVSLEVRESIESTLLLPIASIEKLKLRK